MHRCPSKVWTAWPRRHGPENGQKGRFQSYHRNCCYFTHPRLWLHATTVEKSGTKFLTATKCPRFHFFCLGCLTFLLRSSKLCNTLPLLQELKDQQVNELGKTFMPYTQSNYRMHPMVVMPTKNGEFIVILQGDGRPHRFKTLDEITCFKCGENGHFANKCPKVFWENPVWWLFIMNCRVTSPFWVTTSRSESELSSVAAPTPIFGRGVNITIQYQRSSSSYTRHIYIFCQHAAPVIICYHAFAIVEWYASELFRQWFITKCLSKWTGRGGLDFSLEICCRNPTLVLKCRTINQYIRSITHHKMC